MGLQGGYQAIDLIFKLIKDLMAPTLDGRLSYRCANCGRNYSLLVSDGSLPRYFNFIVIERILARSQQAGLCLTRVTTIRLKSHVTQHNAPF